MPRRGVGGSAGIHSVQRADTKFLLILIFSKIFCFDFQPRVHMAHLIRCLQSISYIFTRFFDPRTRMVGFGPVDGSSNLPRATITCVREYSPHFFMLLLVELKVTSVMIDRENMISQRPDRLRAPCSCYRVRKLFFRSV